MSSLVGQLVFDGLAMGLVFVILATGLVLIVSTSKILFMAYGMFYMIGAYTVWYSVQKLSLPYFVSLPIGVIAAGLLGMLTYVLIFQRLKKVRDGFLATLIAAMGLSMMLNQSAVVIFGSLPRKIPAVFGGRFEVFGVIINVDKLALIIIGTTVTLFLFWVYEKTTIGRAMRAVAFNDQVSSLHGINANWIYALVMGIGTALAGFAGGILAPSYGMSPTMGSNILWSVMLMTMLGGMDSLVGAVVGGAIIGQMLSFGQYFIGSAVQIIIFIAIGIVLYFKPAGLLGRGIDIGI
jgi:branched-chain amino acid transport system permease protein